MLEGQAGLLRPGERRAEGEKQERGEPAANRKKGKGPEDDFEPGGPIRDETLLPGRFLRFLAGHHRFKLTPQQFHKSHLSLISLAKSEAENASVTAVALGEPGGDFVEEFGTPPTCAG